jgi:N6-L-threonylcarbamoyladenine synthase
VANNRLLRATMERLAAKQRLPVMIAQPKHTGDNAGMIAFAAWVDPLVTTNSNVSALSIEPSLALA